MDPAPTSEPELSQTLAEKELTITAQNGSERPNSENLASDHGAQDPVPEGLSDAQLAALDMMLGGAKDSAIAKNLNIGRRTVYRWRVEHPVFGQVLQKRREQLWEDHVDRFRALTALALQRLELQIRNPYAPISMQASKHVVALARLGPASSGTAMPHQKGRFFSNEDPKPEADVK